MSYLLALAAWVLAPEVPVVWTGGESHVAKRELHLIDNDRDWVHLWLRNEGKTAARAERDSYNPHSVPEVDFKPYVIAAVFRMEEGIVEDKQKPPTKFQLRGEKPLPR
ncbi:MAG TPA: hypothetical protein VGE01_00855 [Fimbriimonas sp.]